jgi:hypothetical protein
MLQVSSEMPTSDSTEKYNKTWNVVGKKKSVI